MKVFKRIACACQTLLLACGTLFASAATAAEPPTTASIVSDAQLVTELGILQGDESGVGAAYLNKPTTRIQAGILFLRLKGLEQEALAYKGTDNFSDASEVWSGGQSILAYLRANPSLGWVGVGGNQFDPLSVITAEQYYKVLLEVLGYKQDSDFEFKNVMALAGTVGLGKAGTAKPFTNLHIATATVEALAAKIKGQSKTLAEVLVETAKLNADKLRPLSYAKLEFAAKAQLGTYLVDGSGRTLYYFSKDSADLNACQGKCLENWPVFYSDKLKVPAELDAADFGVITRADGTKQTTYKGWPLYYFAGDKQGGDTNGEAVNNVWYVVEAPSFAAIGNKTGLGNHLTDANGRTLYYFDKDTPGISVCSGKCLENWPVFYAEGIQAPTGTKQEDFGVLVRSDGTKQTTFKGYPLYYFVHDLKRGDTNGQDVNKVWFVVDVSKFKDTTAENPSVKTAVSSELGSYLVDSRGKTLYLFTKDEADLSACQGNCLVNWPIFHSDGLTVSADLNRDDFGTITRADGTMQTTYKGWPLYYFIKDVLPGQTLGQDVNNVWYVLDPLKTKERAQTKEYAIEIADFQFSIPELTIEAGSTVTFTNHDSVKHNAAAVDGSFRTKLLANGESETVLFAKPGVYEYVCEPHKSFMKATIIVKE
ncbi:hypothetical protein J31TS4_40910 [Paenibacillus sp. J31TS4]|uniref:plastocyanin/azurin family copper-binding protein n=1 Tax=Paenibacillus sp. J31TS4 TaxID=2807195 RepID=UPI001B1A1EC1|nr:plastocyanin/azurin family copper-binding protein [Paenibacillus sp. J31TS4]GIP40811.1 hypothetical protein J31TS4_40910 [Paenibacillus sp. J31TS4]